MTTLQCKIIAELNREELNDIGIMQKLHVSHSKYYAEKRIAINKIKKVLGE